ncbi:uncharacterized protein LOC113233897 [Hyposmocoma kahamanoa]|uniref:uncharacterized protein LOC113233897 n=1 Tax=Hyposmocoma kahamanoa TaxID=1477025 RepID=UPI000E6D6B90|nr:uncharacterized protein LOC113233897 [Hyposmocoma kahamanoa]
MDAKLLVAVVGVWATITSGAPVPQSPQSNSQSFVRGVFISSDALKELQDKAQDQPATNAVDLNGNLKLTTTKLNSNIDPGSSLQSQPIVGNTPPLVTRSQTIIGNPQISPVTQPVTNSQQLIVDSTAQLVSNTQPILSNQQTSTGIPNNQNQYLVSQHSNQPNQIFVSQPTNQPILLGQIKQPSSNLPVLITQSPSGQQMLVNQPSQPIYLSQPTNQPIYISQPSNEPILLKSQGTNQQILIRPSNQPTLVYQNGQPTLINNPAGDQVTLVAQSPNTVQNPGTVYAVVPVNNEQSVPNFNGNTYFVPSNSNQVYTISTGK